MVVIKRKLEFEIDRATLTFEATLYDDQENVVDQWHTNHACKKKAHVAACRAQFDDHIQDAFVDIYTSFDQ